jgi:hypothetical protein
MGDHDSRDGRDGRERGSRGSAAAGHGGEAGLEGTGSGRRGVQSADESPLVVLCIDAMTVCAHCYLIGQTLVSKCVGCVWDCGGLLRVSDKELRSWGVSEHEQPARYRVSEREARHMRQELNAARQASKRSAAMGSMAHSSTMGVPTKAGTYVV